MYLGVDLGTSSVKAVVIDDEGALVADASAPLRKQRFALFHGVREMALRALVFPAKCMGPCYSIILTLCFAQQSSGMMAGPFKPALT